MEHDPTIEESYTIEIKTEKGEERKFKILDTAGKEGNKNLIDEWICNANGFILVFSIDDNNSFESIKNYASQINKIKMGGLPIILVGNKCDLDKERKITKENAQEYANSIGATYFECSSLNDENGNCKLIFQDCANKILKKVNTEEKSIAKCTKCFIF